jgi:hypothetical protein
MSTDLEEAIAETLRPRGDGPVDVTSLRRAAVQQAGSIRRRRIVALSAGAVVVAVLAAVPFVRGTGPVGGDTRVGGPGTDGGPVRLLPPAADAPGAKARPDLVGTDPAVLHFSIDLSGTPATGTHWAVIDGVESVSLWTSDFDHYNHRYALSNDPEKLAVRDHAGVDAQPAETRQVSVDGRPATATFWPDRVSANKKPDVPTWTVEWQPAAGLWAKVELHTTDPADAVTAAEAMRVDRSLRCVAPLRFDPAPAGFSLVSCSLSFGHILPWAGSSIEIERTDGVRYAMNVGPGGDDPDHPFLPNRTVRGRSAMVEAGDTSTTLLVLVGGDVMLTVQGPYRWGTVDGIAGRQEVTGTEADLIAIAETIIVGPDVSDPETWPVRALG